MYAYYLKIKLPIPPLLQFKALFNYNGKKCKNLKCLLVYNFNIIKWNTKLFSNFSFDCHMQPACFVWSDTRNDEHCYLTNKCFKTLEEAEKYAKKIAELLKNRDL